MPHPFAPSDLGGSQGGPSGKHWVLDPIDGTRGFVGMRQYSVCLGMLNDGEVHLGILGCPNLPQVSDWTFCRADGNQNDAPSGSSIRFKGIRV